MTSTLQRNGLRDPTNRTAVAQALAATYNGGRYTDAWARVQEYRAVRSYKQANPEASAYAIASALSIPRGRVRPWLNADTSPDPARAIETANDHNWVDLTWTDSSFPALNVLVAWIFAGGSIVERTKVPIFVVSEKTQTHARTALEEIGLSVRISRTDSSKRATELRPTTDASTLGRLLLALGAPSGSKSADQPLTLPSYLNKAPRSIRRDFARTYIWHRGTLRPDRPNTPIQIREERPLKYRRALTEFFNSLVADAVQGDSTSLRLTREAASNLYRPPNWEQYCAE